MKFFIMSFLVFARVVCAEVIPVEPIEKGFLASSAPSMTMYFQGKDSRAVLIFIPGGDGYFGLKEGQTDVNFQQFQSLKRLANPEVTSGKFDEVLLDSPYRLSPRQPYPIDRESTDHLVRIESAMRYYLKKTGLPIWLMGHSNGGISLTAFVKYAQKYKKTELISGIIASGIRTESRFDPPISFPMLFLHHKQDGCSRDLAAASYANYMKVKEFNTFPTEFVYVSGGRAQQSDPCHSGYHMYNGAGEEVAKDIDEFMSKFYN